MSRHIRILSLALAAVMLTGLGCARAARDTTGFAVHEEATVKAPMEDAWQAVKTVLREQEYDIYTRDKRGAFTAYSDAHRVLMVQPKREKYTIDVIPVSDSETKVVVEGVRQIYGVTLLTYPGWHDRKLTDNTQARALLDAVAAKLGGAPAVQDAAPADKG
ncbi:MAG TPA: hypothetical protein PKN23_03570 [Candidatus Hydrogenedentes bacterium]|nr:hypothetical protein [Candidatus Hydrogenedentota bacterium]